MSSLDLATFVKTCVDTAFEGCDMDGGSIQDLAVECGVLKQVVFDPAVHRDPEGYTEAGDWWFVHTDEFRTALSLAKSETPQ